MRGLRPVAEIMFGDFLALAADQILNHASKYRWMYNGGASVPMVVRAPMGGRRGYGPTHSQSIEAMFMGVPGLAIVAPPPLLDPGALLLRAISLGTDPTLFTENKPLYGRRLMAVEEGRHEDFFVQSTDSFFPTLRLSLAEGEEPAMVLVTYGGSVPLAMDAAIRLMMEREILCDLVIPSQLWPVPVAEIRSFAGRTRRFATLEEGCVEGGWGAEVVAALADSAGPREFVRLGAPSSPIPSAKQLESDLLPSVDSVFERLYRFHLGASAPWSF